MSERKREIVEEAVASLKEAGEKAPEIKGIPMGVEGLDELFFTTKITAKGPKKVPLGGFPQYAVMNLTGISDTGKSLIVEQFALTQANNNLPVAFITVETPAAFLAIALKNRAQAMGINYEEVEEKIVIIDAASYHVLREEIPTLLDTLAYAIKKYHIKVTVIDSVTGLFEAKEMFARTVVRQLFNFMKKWYQTALFVSQKRSGHEELSAEAAGGYAVSHIVDGAMVLSKKVISSSYDERLYKRPIGELIHLFRIDGCRLCGHDTDTHLMEITETGLVKIGPSLKQLKKV
jgi:KaiC domain protein